MTRIARSDSKGVGFTRTGQARGSRWALVFPLACVFIATSCAPTLRTIKPSKTDVAAEAQVQNEIATKTYAAYQDRLTRVANRLADASGELCAAPGYDYGLLLRDLKSNQGPAPRETPGYSNRRSDFVTISTVRAGGPAARAGLVTGDTLVAISGILLKGKTAEQAYELVTSREALDTACRSEAMRGSWTGSNRPGVLAFTFRRGGKERTLEVKADVSCEVIAIVELSDAVNAYADGSRVIVTSAMMDFVTSDDELSLVVGHEMSHNSLGHIDKRAGNSFLGSLADQVVGAKVGINTHGLGKRLGSHVFTKQFEREADYQGMYLAARAGYNIAQSTEFWRRFAAVHPNTKKSGFFASHPSGPERFVALNEVEKEIHRKRSAKLPLVPNRRSDPEPSSR
jgi:hypothetical protein